jgi:hypothetical protein
MNTDFENGNRLQIEQAIEGMLPEKLANGLTRKQARILYMGENQINMTDSGLFVKDRKLNNVPVEDHLKTFIDRFGVVKSEIEAFSKRSEVESYFENNNTPLSEQSGILAKAMKNEGFKINE